MTPRPGGRRAGTLAWLVLVLAACGTAPTTSPRRPNVLVVTLDTTRADRLGCYGYAPALTPRLDALAADGVRFDAAYTPSPMTLPAHASLFTGLAPPEHGVRINGRQRLGDDVPTLAAMLAASGYRTGAFVAAYVVARRFGLDRGFEVYDDDLQAAVPQVVQERLSVHRPGDAVVDAALAWLRTVAAGPAPFFAWVHLYDAHYPRQPHAALDGTRYGGASSYDAAVAFDDVQVGRLLDFLAANGHRDDTIVAVVGDHGEGLGDHGEEEHGYLLNEEVLHVPMLIRAPDPHRGVARAIVSLTDVAPTLLEATGIAPARPLPGRVLTPALRGEPLVSRPAYAETDLPLRVFGWSPLRSLTTDDWKYVRTTEPELYARAADRVERSNVAAAHPDVVADMDARLATIERGFAVASAPSVALDPAARARLAALGYVDPGATPATPPGRLPDVKRMLPLKQRSQDLTAAIAAGRIDRDGAIAELRALIAASPESAAFHLRLGTLLLEARRPAEAVTALAEAVRLRPDDADGRTNLGQALVRVGRLEDALPEFRAAIAAAPDQAESHLGLGSGLAALGSLDQAETELREASRLDPTSADARLNLGNVLLRRGLEADAIAAYREALRLRPEFALAHHDLATVLARGDATDEALAHAREAVRLAPDLAPAQHLLGRLLVEADDLPGAIAAYETAIRLDPTAPEYSDDLAAAYASVGDTGRAVTTGREAVAKANAQGRADLARDIRGRVAFYRESARPGGAVSRRPGGTRAAAP